MKKTQNKNDISKTNIKKLAEEARRLIASPEGQQAVKEALQRASETEARFKEAEHVDTSVLHEPMTI